MKIRCNRIAGGKWAVFVDDVPLTKSFPSRKAARDMAKQIKDTGEIPEDLMQDEHRESQAAPTSNAQTVPTPAPDTDTTTDPPQVPLGNMAQGIRKDAEAAGVVPATKAPEGDGWLLRVADDPNGWLRGVKIVTRNEATVYTTSDVAWAVAMDVADEVEGVAVEVVPASEPSVKSYLLRQVGTVDQWLRRLPPKAKRKTSYTIVPRHRATVFTRIKWAESRLREAGELLPDVDAEIVELG